MSIFKLGVDKHFKLYVTRLLYTIAIWAVLVESYRLLRSSLDESFVVSCLSQSVLDNNILEH